MIRKLFPNIFQITVPLPHSPLKHLNSYLITSKEENLLIDTGLDSPLAFQTLCTGLSEAGVHPKELTQIMATHFHIDHVGLIARFKKTSEKIQILIHNVEAELSKIMTEESDDYEEKLKTFLKTNGAPESIADLKSFHPAFFTPQAYRIISTEALPVRDEQVISVGNYNFQIRWTPGHSPGHICLYEPSLKILISGDHLLPTITPHVARFMEDMNPLMDYLRSLDRVAELDIEAVLPGHEHTFINHHKRIEQLKEHHRRRLNEITEELKSGRSTAYMLASKIHWHVNYNSWNEFPLFQKYLALGETLAHLNFLEHKQVVKTTQINHTTLYDLAGAS